jgi:hypothetical protein
MATRSTISIVTERTKDGVGRTIYSHWDGYPSHNGRILLEHYKDAEKINFLIDLGDISILAENVSPKKEGIRRKMNEKYEYDLIPTKEPHSFDEPHQGVVVAYGRDRGEKDVEASSFKGKTPDKRRSEEYDYLFVESENKWYVRDNYGSKRPRFVELTEKVCNKN